MSSLSMVKSYQRVERWVSLPCPIWLCRRIEKGHVLTNLIQGILDTPKCITQCCLSDSSLYMKCPSQKSAMTDALSKPFRSIPKLMLQILFRMKNLVPTFAISTLVLSLLWSTPPIQNSHISHQHAVNPFEL